MGKIEVDDIDSEESEDLKEEELMAMNRHFRNRRSSRASKMTTQMQALYKEALMDTFFGRFQQASKKLKNHIALYPDHSQAYHLLGTMYEQLGQNRNAVEYFFMSAYLSPPNFQKWKKVGQMSFDLQMYNQSAYCYGRALKIENYNIQLMSRRAQAYEQSHQTKKAISTYKKILSITFSLPILKQYAKLRFKRGEFKTARQILMEFKDHQKDAHVAYMICETFLKDEKFEDLLEYISEFLKIKQQEEKDFTLENLNLQFTIFLYICLVRLKRNEFEAIKQTSEDIKKILLEGYDESYAKEFELLISCIKSDQKILRQILEFLIRFSPHKTVDNYLLYSEFLKNSSEYEKAISLLKEGLSIHKNSVQLTSQLNHLKVVSGTWKETKRKQVIDFKNKKIKSQHQNIQDIFYSDDEDLDQKQPELIQLEQIHQKESKAKLNNLKTSKISKNNHNKSIQTEDPQIIKRLLNNCIQTLKSIISEDDNEMQYSGNYVKQVEDCINFVLNLTSPIKNDESQEKQGLFNKSYRRRRYFTSKQSTRQQFIQDNLNIILKILQNIIEFLKRLLLQKQFQKAKHLAQILSKAYFFRWQNKSFELKTIKKQLYEIGLLSCLSLQKYQTAVFFVKYLAHRQPDNSFYLLVVNYLIHNSNSKICMNSLLGKYVNRNLMINSTKSIESNNGFSMMQEDNFFQDDLGSQNLSYPRKMSMVSNFSDIIRDNSKLNYLFGIEYMETGCFDLAISSFLKAVRNSDKQIKKTIWLCISSCFLQISSSRTCHSKLPQTNCSTYCLWQYLNIAQDSVEKSFNKARFFAQLRLNSKAIRLFIQILESKDIGIISPQIELKSAHCLMCIYKEIQEWDKLNEISIKYFNVQNTVNN